MPHPSHAHNHAPHSSSAPPHRPAGHSAAAGKPATFSKIFRWQPATPKDPQPAAVEIAGSFTNWKKVPLKHDATNKNWQLTLHNIPSYRTHSYMLFVDGQPTSDKNSDGLAVPQTDVEKQHALTTVRGPRVFMLFSQTK